MADPAHKPTIPVDNTVDSKTAADYLDPTREPEPSEETGPGTHFKDTFDPAYKKGAPAGTVLQSKSAQEKLAHTDSTMTTAQLQKAAQEGDPNGLLGKKPSGM